MDSQDMPRIALATCDTTGRFRLRITWTDGLVSLVDLSSHFIRFKLYQPICDGRLPFDGVMVGEYGADLVWTDQIDVSADTVWRLAQEQRAERFEHAAR